MRFLVFCNVLHVWAITTYNIELYDIDQLSYSTEMFSVTRPIDLGYTSQNISIWE